MAGMLYKPKIESFLLLVRRLLCRKSKSPADKDGDGERRSLLTRRSLEELLLSDAGGGGAATVCRCVAPGGKKDGQAVLLLRQQRLAAAPVSAAGRAGVTMHRRLVFGGFRRRLLRRPWQPMLVAIPE